MPNKANSYHLNAIFVAGNAGCGKTDIIAR
jgi:hypothetical protein